MALAVASATLSAACAEPAETAPRQGAEAVDLRVLVKLVRPSLDGIAIALQASEQAGVPAIDMGPVSEAWHAVRLRCPSTPACDRAIARLRAASGVYEAVELDGRKRSQN